MKFPALLLACALLASCAVETVPRVSVGANSSGLTVSKFQAHGPKSLLGGYSYPDSKPNPPDVPSGASARISRQQALHNKEPRYFIPASGSLEVVSIERPGDYSRRGRMAESIHFWRSFADSPGPLGEEDKNRMKHGAYNVDEIPWTNAAQCFHAKLRRASFPWGNAVLFLTTYVQGKTGGPVNNDMLVLHVQGFTHDGRYAVKAEFEIRHPKLPDSLWDKRARQKAYFDIDDETKQAEAWLDSQNDASFRPTISTYIELLRALKIEPGEPFKP